MDTVLDITFPGGKKVNAQLGEIVIPTDQSPASGGEGTAPEPFQLFLASLGTCAGIYALSYCEARGVSADDLQLKLICHRNEAERRFDRMELVLKVPADFSEKDRIGVHRAMDLCAVKKHIVRAPEFSVRVE